MSTDGATAKSSSSQQCRSISERQGSSSSVVQVEEDGKPRCLSFTNSYIQFIDDQNALHDVEQGITVYPTETESERGEDLDPIVHRTYACPGDREKRAAAKALVLQIDEDGDMAFAEMSHFDVLRMTQEVAKEPEREDGTSMDEVPHMAAEVGSRAGGPSLRRRSSRRILETAHSIEYGNVVDVQCVHVRDIRRLSNTFASSNEPSVIIRKQAILMNADPLRAVVMRNACLIFVPDGADSLVLYLKRNVAEFVAQSGGSNSDVPFEFRAIEALLATIAQCFNTDYEKLSAAVTTTLDKLARGRLEVGDLEAMRTLKNDMSEFEAQVDGVRRTLVELLDNEEDLRLLYLSKLNATPALLNDLFSFDSEESEVLVENYLQDIVSTRSRAMLLQNRIQTTESLIMMKLDTTRNYLLGVDLVFSLVGIAFAAGTFISGAFGMNLNSHVDLAEGWFWGVVAFSLVLLGAITVVGIMFFRRKGVFM